jgi:CHAD domain-containing protein
MSFAFHPGQNIPKQAVKMYEQRLDKVADALEAALHGDSVDACLHTARRRTKQARALVRVLELSLGKRQSRTARTRLRDLTRPLSAARDARVRYETLDALVRDVAGDVRPNVFADLRAQLVEEHERTRAQVRDQIPKLLRDVARARSLAAGWSFAHRRWRTLELGAFAIHHRGERAMRRALGQACDDRLHDWRKCAKELRYAFRLITPMWPQLLAPLGEEVHRLERCLGEDHDLVELSGAVARADAALLSPSARTLFQALLEQKRRDRREHAHRIGARVYSERAMHIVQPWFGALPSL